MQECFTKRSKISPYLLWHDSQSMFSIDFAALYSIVTFNNNSTSSSLHMNDSGLFPSFLLAFLPFDMFPRLLNAAAHAP